ncbi:MAG TPA: hypothetical protein VK436_07855 [Methanocella sp.]|nr:hypothetical protein [Methanocella sp.]
MDMTELSDIVQDMAKNLGACATGIATVETMAGGPPSADISYMLPGARAAVCFALPLDQATIEPYLQKKCHDQHNLDKIRQTTLAAGISLEMSTFLTQLDYRSMPVPANFQYRNDQETSMAERKPPISHRYLAVRSGIGHFGLSGNVIMAKYGAAIALGSVVTQAPLLPTDPLPEEGNYCDGCRLCRAVCASGFISPDEISEVVLGGRKFDYAKRKSYARCSYICGGYAGLDRSGKWSTWTPSRYPIPEKDEDFPRAFADSVDAYIKRPITDHVYYNSVKPGFRTEYTCGNCQLVCHPDKSVRQRRAKMVLQSGAIVQNPDGSKEAVKPEEARRQIDEMEPERRRLYEP